MKINKIIGKIVSVTMVVMAVCSVVPVFANTEIDWARTASTPGATIETGTATKVNTTPVRVWYDDGNSTKLGCTVYARNTSGNYVDVTYYSPSYTPYYAVRNAGYVAVRSTAYETYGNCRVKACMVTTNAGSHSGRWMPYTS